MEKPIHPQYSPSGIEAILITIAVIGILGYMMIAQGTVPHMALLTAIIFLLFYGLFKKVPFKKLQDGMSYSVLSSMGAIYLFFFIGILVASLMLSGAIPSLIYYGFTIISPKYFYLSAFLITALIGVSIGSSLTTCATLGVALIGLAQAFQADLAITAGAIVSGAFFGDKMSPFSDTTTISASIVGVDLFTHIRNMLNTTIPALIISAVVFTYFSFQMNANIDLQSVEVFKENLLNTGFVHIYTLLPFIILIALAVLRINALTVLMITSTVAIAIGVFMHTGTEHALNFSYIMNTLFGGFKYSNEAAPELGRILSRGGIQGMFFTMTIIILALSLGGLLFVLGIIPKLLDGTAHLITKASRATFFVAATSVLTNVLIGEQYLSILLAGETFKPVYDKLGLHRKNLSRTLEDAGTVINPLVPWSVCGGFIAEQLGVPVLDYLPFAIFCYGSLILTLLFGWSGLTISEKK